MDDDAMWMASRYSAGFILWSSVSLILHREIYFAGAKEMNLHPGLQVRCVPLLSFGIIRLGLVLETKHLLYASRLWKAESRPQGFEETRCKPWKLFIWETLRGMQRIGNLASDNGTRSWIFTASYIAEGKLIRWQRFTHMQSNCGVCTWKKTSRRLLWS